MAVKIRLMRVGKRKQPSYRVVVADGRSPRDGRYIEIIGQYGPREEPSRVLIDDDKALAWLRKGAQPTDVVQKLLTETGVWARYLSEGGKALASRPSGTTRTEPKLSKKAQARATAEAGAAPDATDAPETPDASAPETASDTDADDAGDSGDEKSGAKDPGEETSE